MKLTPTEPDIRTIVERIDQHDIDLQPDFQRQEVWSLKKKKRLIDTVLRGWSIPPIHLVETSENQLEVLDGQQRLASLRDFVHNKFSIDAQITPVDSNIAPLHGKFYRQLDNSVRRRIDQYPIRCFRISDYMPEEPSELFYRLNQPTMLTAGEQRNALYGPARQQLKDTVEFFEQCNNRRETVGFSNLRLAYDDIIARLLFFLESKSISIKGTESRISERFRSQYPFDALIIKRARRSIEHFSVSREMAALTRFNKASLLSWLLFFSRFSDEDQVDTSCVRSFSRAKEGGFTAHHITEAAAVFENRASLRVTDVSSVVYRDFILAYIYKFTSDSRLPKGFSEEKIQYIETVLNIDDELTFEQALRDNLEIEAWSATL